MTVMSMERLGSILQECPFHALFNLTIDSVDSAQNMLSMKLGFTPGVTRDSESGQYHGGVIASLIDIAGDFALIALLEYPVPTINLRVDYLRAAARCDLIAHARVRKAGKSVGVVDIEVLDDQKRLIALGRGCYGTRA